MIKLENFEVLGWEHAIRGMRNPMNSWEKSDSEFQPCAFGNPAKVGEADHELMMKLANAGPVHGKFRRMITVYVDITAPLYWWKEFDTYKVGTVANSCSTMHKIHDKEFTIEDFSCERLCTDYSSTDSCIRMSDNDSKGWDLYPENLLRLIIIMLNKNRDKFLETKNKIKNLTTASVAEEKRLKDLAKKYWWQMIQLLPSSYNQKRTVMLNYEVLAGIYKYRKDHKLDEWREFCSWIERLPYSEIITGNAGGGVSLIDGHID